MQHFWCFIFLFCIAIIGSTAIPIKEGDDYNSVQTFNENENDTSATIRILENIAKILSKQRSNLSSFSKVGVYDNPSSNDGTGFNINGPMKKRQMRYHQCYFNPISCFRRRR